MPKAKKDLAMSLGSQIAFKVLGFGVVALLARMLTPEEYGQLSFALSACTFGIIFTDLGLSTDLVRKVAAEPSSALSRLSRVISARLPLVVVFLVLINLITLATKPEILPVTIGISLFAALKDTYRSFSSIFIAHRLISRNILSFGAGSLVMLSGIAVSHTSNLGMSGVIPSYIAGGATMLAFGSFQLRKEIGKLRFGFGCPRFSKIAFSALPLFGLTCLTNAHFALDVIAIGYLGTYADVAAYEVAGRLFEASQFAIRPLTLIMFPICSKLVADSLWPDMKALTVKMYLGAAGIGTLATLCAYFLSEPIIVIVYSETFRDSSTILQILYASVPSLFLSSVGIFIAASLHREGQACIAIGVCLLLKLIVNLWAIPHYGPIGAAVVNFATQSMIAFWLVADSFSSIQRKR